MSEQIVVVVKGADGVEYRIGLGSPAAGSLSMSALEDIAKNLKLKFPASVTTREERAVWLKRNALKTKRWWYAGQLIDLEPELAAMAERTEKGGAVWRLGRPKSAAGGSTAAKKATGTSGTKRIIALSPFGWGQTTKLAATAKLAAQYRQSWPFHVPSFEVWATMLQFDPAYADGGVRFQRMLHFLLVDGRRAGNSVANASSTTFQDFYMDTQRRGDLHVTPEPLSDAYFDAETQQYVYVSTEARLWEGQRGGRIGYNLQHTDASETGKGFTGLQGKALERETVVSVRPGSKGDWLKKFGVNIGRYNVQGKAVNQQFTRGHAIGAVTDVEEVRGHLAMGNMLAMLVGLYYYQGCNDPRLNWVVRHTVEGRPFDVRMRAPNPSYTVVNDHYLRPREPVNPEVVRQMRELGVEHASRYIGNETDTFHVPSMHERRGVPETFLDHYADPSHDYLVTTVAPFFGDTTGPYNSSKAPIDRAYNLRLHLSLGEVVHRPEQNAGFFFGFRSAKALWLYPHHSMDGDSVELVQGAQQHPPGFQPLPRWRDGLANGAWRQDTDLESYQFFELFRAPQGFRIHELFHKKTLAPAEVAALRRWALDLTADAPTQPANAAGSSMQASMTGGASTEEPEPPLPRSAVPEADNEQRVDYDQPETLYDRDGIGERQGDAALLRSDQVDVSYGDEALGITDPAVAAADAGEIEMARAERGETIDLTRITGTEALSPGAPIRPGKERNEHFTSPLAQPWPHADLYDDSGMLLRTEQMNDAAVLEYQRKYGTTQNLYIRSAEPQRIVTVDVNFGFAKVAEDDEPFLFKRITDPHPVCRKHLRAILAIYYHGSDIGPNACTIPAADVRKGMLGGVWMPWPQTTQNYQRPVYGKPKGKAYRQLWPPVFTREPDRAMAECFEFDRYQGIDKRTLAVESARCAEENIVQFLSTLRSEMTVLQWITSPWHYSYLPYQPQKALFKDGETYSEGCRRCSRPFHEPEFLYMAYKDTHPKARHWPTTYFYPDDRRAMHLAPMPFHKVIDMPQYQQLRRPVFVALAADSNEAPQQEWGHMKWETYAFVMPQNEREKRVAALPWYKDEIKLKRPITYRKTMNHVYDESRQQIQDVPIVQGRLATERARVKYGQSDYYLQRAARFGNVCSDCAQVLELAPGLYLRNHKIVKPLTVLKQNKVQSNLASDWWPNMLRVVGIDDEYMPDLLHNRPERLTKNMSPPEREEYMRKWDDVMTRVSEELARRNSEIPTSRSKFLTPPEINIQGCVNKRRQREVEGERMADAIRTLKGLVGLHDAAQPGPSQTQPTMRVEDMDFTNPVLKDMILELERKYMHKAVLKHAPRDHVTVFDSNMQRIEYRNVVRTKDGTRYNNCLEVRTWKPSLAVAAGEYNPQTDEFNWPNRDDYHVVIYYANRLDAEGRADTGGSAYVTDEGVVPREPRSQWRGDGYVSRYNRDARRWEDRDPMPPRAGTLHLERGVGMGTKQIRTMRQSRLFITYSLHRAVSSEMEARLVMERMASAVHLIFGDDRIVSQLLLFGQKLAGFTKDGGTTNLNKQSNVGYKQTVHNLKHDTISGAQFVKITEPRKKEALETFYAEVGGSSYIYDTYETHVESIEVDGGIEIGPVMRHPHFHVLITINHWSYVQIDYFKMNHFLELLFRGQDPYNWFGDNGETARRDFMLLDASGFLFYTDNENPYVDIRLYPQDNWDEIIAAYVRKGTTDKGVFDAIRGRYDPVGTAQRQAA